MVPLKNSTRRRAVDDPTFCKDWINDPCFDWTVNQRFSNTPATAELSRRNFYFLTMNHPIRFYVLQGGKIVPKEMNNVTIFCIDDDPDILSLLQKILTTAGYSVIVASDGKRGIDKALIRRRSFPSSSNRC
ncbi:MAG: response regulator [Smithella sp.]|jgi:PleD family two-component response regulator|nr:hypothetical protein [Smithellaceae bacterium]NLA40332.1 response regulator [Smithella sp.]